MFTLYSAKALTSKVELGYNEALSRDWVAAAGGLCGARDADQGGRGDPHGGNARAQQTQKMCDSSGPLGEGREMRRQIAKADGI